MTQAFLFDACCFIGAAVTAAAYAIGLARLSARGVAINRRSVALFGAAWLCAVLPVLSPLHDLGHTVFWLHMIEHESLILVAAPLFVLARPGPIFLWALPRGPMGRVQSWLLAPRTRAIWAQLTRPAVAVVLHGATLWIWHAPALFEAALVSAGACQIQSVAPRSEEHTSELQSHVNLVCRLLLEKKKKKHKHHRRMESS